jgi:hypothetical protein
MKANFSLFQALTGLVKQQQFLKDSDTINRSFMKGRKK